MGTEDQSPVLFIPSGRPKGTIHRIRKQLRRKSKWERERPRTQPRRKGSVATGRYPQDKERAPMNVTWWSEEEEVREPRGAAPHILENGRHLKYHFGDRLVVAPNRGSLYAHIFKATWRQSDPPSGWRWGPSTSRSSPRVTLGGPPGGARSTPPWWI